MRLSEACGMRGQNIVLSLLDFARGRLPLLPPPLESAAPAPSTWLGQKLYWEVNFRSEVRTAQDDLRKVLSGILNTYLLNICNLGSRSGQM